MYRSSPPPAASSDSEISELDSLVRELRSLQIQEAAKLGFGPDNRSSRYQEPPRYTNSYDDDNQDDQDLFGDLAVLQGHAPHPSQKAQSSGVSPVNRLFQPDTVQLLHLSPQNPTEQRIRRAFINQWNATPKPYVSHVFLVLHNSPSAQAHVNDFDAYRDQVENQVRPTPATTSAFHGTRRACWIGLSPSRTNPCNDPTCSVCRILEGSFMVSKSKGGLYGYGIYNSTDSHKSDNYQNNKDGGFRAQFLTTVVTGRKNYMPRQAPAGASLPGNGYHSVEGHATGPNETVVYRDDAMFAHALIMYSTDRQIQTYRTPVTLSHHSVYFITNLLVPKALDLSLSDHRVSGYRPHGKDNQQWVLEKEGGGWAIRNKQRADMYLGLESQNYFVNGSRAAGVSYDQRVIWEIQSAEDNTFRLAILHNNSHNLDLDKRDINQPGSVPDGAAVTLWNHVANAGQQRWVFDYIETWKGANSATPGGGQQVQVPQNNAIYTLTNNRYRTRLDYSISTSRVVGFQSRASDNQKWIFQQEGSGWVIRSKHDPNQYLAVQYGSFGDGTNIVVGPYNNRVTWQVKAAMNNCVRINPVGHWGSEIDLSTRWGASPGAAVVLYHHIVNQTNQRWELVSTGEWYSGGNSGYQPGQNNGSFQRGPGSQTQKPVNNGVYTLRNEQYSSVIDYSQGHGTIVGYSSNLKDNQLWIFQREGSGWVLKNRAEQGKYLGLQYGSYLNGTHLAPVDYSNRVVWEVKDAENNTVRINASGYWSSEIDLSTRGGSNPGTPVILYHHINNAANQRWRLMFHGTQF